MEVASAFVKYVGEFSQMDKQLAEVPGKAEPGAKAAGGMFATHIGNGIKVGIGGLATSGLAAAMLKLAEPLERSQVDLENAFKNSGHSIEDYRGQIQKAVQDNEKYGTSQQATQESLSKLTVAYGDPQKALKMLGEASDLAAYKHIGLTDATSLLIKMTAGNGKAFKEFGINIKDATKLLAEQTLATKNHELAQKNLEAKTKALSDLEARDAGVKKLSVSQLQQLRDAHKAVADAQTNVATTGAAQEAATKAAAGATKDYGKIIQDQVLPKIKGLREAQAATFFGQMQSAETHVKDFAGSMGGKLAPALTVIGPTMMGAGAILESGVLKMIGSGAKLVASWVADTAKFLVQQAIRLGAWVAANAVMVATAIATGIAAAAAFMLPLLPFILIGLAVAGLVVLIVTHFDQIKAVVTGAVGFVINWVKQNWPLLLTILLGPFGLAVGFIIQHFDQIRSFASKLIDDISGFFSQLPGRVLGFFTSLPGKLMQVGKDMIHAIAQGLASAAGNVPVIGGALKSFLQSFEGGGIVAGTGPQLVIAHGGEKILTAAEQRHGGQGKGGDQVIHNHFEAPIDPNAGAFMGREIAWQLKTAT